MNSIRLPGAIFSADALQSFNRFFARLAFFALLLPCFYFSSSLFWRVVYPEGYARHFEENREVSPENSVEGKRMRQWAWFEDSSAPVIVKPARPSKLDATLVGVLSPGSEENETGMAFIALKSRRQKLVRIGDEVAPATYLKRVRTDHVVLQRDDQEEILELKKAGLFGDHTNRSSKAAAGKAGPQSLGGKLRRLAKSDMGALVKSIKFKKVAIDGKNSGFSVDPKNRKGREILREFGIEAKDVLLSANGNDLSNIMSNPTKIQKILESREVKVKLMRKGKVKEISVK